MNCNDEFNLRVLGYADDAALTEERIQEMTERLTKVGNKSKEKADMQIRMDKTFSHHVQEDDQTITVTQEEIAKAQEKFAHKCDFCDRKFKTLAAMRIHRDKCPYNYATTDEAFEVEEIVGVFGRINSRWFRVKYAGYSEPEWNREHLLLRDGCRDTIRSFWEKSGMSPTQEFYDVDAHKCEVCAREFKRKQDLKAHKTRAKHHYHQIQMKKLSGKAKQDAVKKKKQENQDALPKAKWGEKAADNCWRFKYLGATFTPDGGHIDDVRERIAMAQSRHGTMRHIWKSKDLHIRLKMRLYVSAVCSIMIYGSEAWRLDEQTRRALNGANSKMVAAITGRTIHEEATTGKTYDVVAGIRATRLRWLGHILRLEKTPKGEERLIKKAVKLIYHNRAEGDILMDAPSTNNWQELIKAAQDRKKWALGVRSIKDLIYVAALKKKPKAKGKRKSNNKGKARKKKSRPKYKMVGTGLDAILVPCVYSDESEEEEDNGSDDEDNDSKPATTLAPIRKVIICRDGFRMSVQASKDHACTPRDDLGPYAAVEVGFPSEIEPLLMPFSDTPNIYTSIVPDIYANVPADTIRAVIQYHAGL